MLRPQRSFPVWMAAFLFPLCSTAQFSLDWQKPLALSDDKKEVKDITCVSTVDSLRFIAYIVNWGGKDFPGVSVLSPDESLKNVSDFSTNKGLDGYRIVSLVKTGKDTVAAWCNDYQPPAGSTLPSLPSEMLFTYRQGKLEFLDYYPINLSDTTGVTKMEITDAVQGAGTNFYMAIHLQKGVSNFINIYKIQNGKVAASRTIEKAIKARLWWGDDDNLVLSSETPFSTGSRKQYYEIQMLDKDLNTVRKYPPTLEYLDSNATDELVRLSYRPLYHVGMVARQVQDLKGKNRMNWYAYNGFPDGTYNKVIGDNKNLIIGANTVHPAGEKVVYNYDWPGSGTLNWVVSEQSNPQRSYNDLIFSIETFTGLQLARDTFGKVTADILGNLNADAATLKDVGSTDIDRRYSTIKCFEKEGERAVYVVRNNPKKLLEKAGIMLSKFSLDMADERLDNNYLQNLYKKNIYYDATALPATDKRRWQLVELSTDDPMYSQRNELVNQELKLESELSPLENTWYWSGDVKIGKKKYHLSKAVISVL